MDNKNARGLMATLLEMVSDGVIILDQDRRIIYMNPTAERLMDLQPHAALERSIFELLPDRLHAAFELQREICALNPQIAHPLIAEPGRSCWAILTAHGMEVPVRASLAIAYDMFEKVLVMIFHCAATSVRNAL